MDKEKIIDDAIKALGYNKTDYVAVMYGIRVLEPGEKEETPEYILVKKDGQEGTFDTEDKSGSTDCRTFD